MKIYGFLKGIEDFQMDNPMYNEQEVFRRGLWRFFWGVGDGWLLKQFIFTICNGGGGHLEITVNLQVTKGSL